MNEDVRYRLYRFGAHAAWWTAFGWTVALTWVNLSRPATALPNTFQRVSGLFIILLMGIAIALGSALSRMRLAKTVAQVFRVGADVAAAGSRERQNEIITLLKEDLEIREREHDRYQGGGGFG
jgi:hypothetical protein